MSSRKDAGTVRELSLFRMVKNGSASSEKMHPGTSDGMTKTEKLSQSGVMALNSKLTFYRKDVNQFLFWDVIVNLLV